MALIDAARDLADLDPNAVDWNALAEALERQGRATGSAATATPRATPEPALRRARTPYPVR